MTNEEKIKAYDEAIERAKNFIENGDERERTIAESIFAGIMEETEDEKVWKAIKEAVCYYWCDDTQTKTDCLLWLEKQGEQKPTKFKIGDLVVKKDGNLFSNGSKFAQITKIEIEKDPERYWFDCGSWLNAEDIKLWKPSWSEDDNLHLKNAILAAEKEWGLDSFTAKWLKSLKPKPKQEWSAEDNKMIKNIENSLNVYSESHPCLKVVVAEELEWLKSLKDRVQPQTKQKWSEEDEKMCESTIDVLVNNTMSGSEGDKVYSEEIDWLKSIKPRWKPSEEQMYILNWVANILLSNNSIVEREAAKILNGLYNNLNSL